MSLNIPLISDSLQHNFDQLLHLRNLTTHYASEADKIVKAIMTELSKTLKGLTSDEIRQDDFDVFQYLTDKESLELSNIESIRSNLAGSWRYLEERKRALIEIAKEGAQQ